MKDIEQLRTEGLRILSQNSVQVAHVSFPVLKVRERFCILDYFKGGQKLTAFYAVDYSDLGTKTGNILHTKTGSNQFLTTIQTLQKILIPYSFTGEKNFFPFGADAKLQPKKPYQKSFESLRSCYLENVDSAKACKAKNVENLLNMIASYQTLESEYLVVFILITSGKINKKEILKCLTKLNDKPISLIFIGIGPGRFSGVKSISGMTSKLALDTRFVNFVSYENVKSFSSEEDFEFNLTNSCLEELTSQFLIYCKSTRKVPNGGNLKNVLEIGRRLTAENSEEELKFKDDDNSESFELLAGDKTFYFGEKDENMNENMDENINENMDENINENMDENMDENINEKVNEIEQNAMEIEEKLEENYVLDQNNEENNIEEEKLIEIEGFKVENDQKEEISVNFNQKEEISVKYYQNEQKETNVIIDYKNVQNFNENFNHFKNLPNSDFVEEEKVLNSLIGVESDENDAIPCKNDENKAENGENDNKKEENHLETEKTEIEVESTIKTSLIEPKETILSENSFDENDLKNLPNSDFVVEEKVLKSLIGVESDENDAIPCKYYENEAQNDDENNAQNDERKKPLFNRQKSTVGMKNFHQGKNTMRIISFFESINICV